MDYLLRFLGTQFQRLARRWRLKFQDLVEVAKDGLLVIKDCPHPHGFHLVFWVAATSLVLPFKIKVTDKHYARLHVPGWPRRLVTSFVAADIIANVFVMVSVAFRHHFKIMAVGGNFTIDGLIYFTLSINTIFTVIYIIILQCVAEKATGLYNAWKKFTTEYTEDVLRDQHLCQIFPHDMKLNVMSSMLPCLTLGVPFFATVLVSLYQECPLLMTSYVANLESAWLSPFMLRLIAVAHTSAVYTLIHIVLLFIAALLFEVSLEMTFMLRTLRMDEFKRRSLTQIRLHHAVLEITVAIINEVLQSILPLVVSHVCSAAVFCIALGVKLASVPEIPLYVPTIAFVVVFGLLFCLWCITRLVEDLRSESLDFNKWLQHQMFLKELRKRKEGGRLLRMSCRVFCRRAVGIRMGFFYQVEAGVALDYLLSAFDKAISLILMVDTTYPITLLVF